MIDKKGRIFGKINIIDFVVVILVLCLIGGLGYKLFIDKESKQDIVIEQPTEAEKGTVYATFKINSLPPETLSALQVGDKLIINDTVSNIEIISVESSEAKYVSMTADGQLAVADNPVHYDCTIKVKASGVRDKIGISIGGDYFRVNQSREIVTHKFYGVSRLINLDFETQE